MLGLWIFLSVIGFCGFCTFWILYLFKKTKDMIDKP